MQQNPTPYYYYESSESFHYFIQERAERSMTLPYCELGWGWVPTTMALCLLFAIIVPYISAAVNGHVDIFLFYIEY